jgi:GTP 3',8-cyclase
MAKIEPISGHNDRVNLKDVLPLETPFTLNIFPINACNFKCNFCAQSLGANGMKAQYNYNVSENMSIETFKAIIDGSKGFDKPYKLLSFMGHGEPLLNQNLPQMVKLAKESNIAQRIEIITNGSLLTANMSDQLIEAGITNIRISLEGLSSSKYKEVSKIDINFDLFLKNLEYFHKKGKDKGSRLFVKVLDCTLEENEEDKFYKLFDSICTRMYIEKVKPVYDNVEFTKNIEDLTTDRYGNIHKPRIVCPLAFFSLAVWPNGDIAPCDAIYKPIVLGNVLSDKLSDIFNSPKANEFRLKLLNGEKNIMYGCHKCCAPDDVSHEKDVLDDYKEELLVKYKGK